MATIPMTTGHLLHGSGTGRLKHGAAGHLVHNAQITRAKTGQRTTTAAAVSDMQADASWGSPSGDDLAGVQYVASFIYYYSVLGVRSRYANAFRVSFVTEAWSGDTLTGLQVNVHTLASGRTGYLSVWTGSGSNPATPITWADCTSQPQDSTSSTGAQTFTLSSSVTLDKWLMVFAWMDAYPEPPANTAYAFDAEVTALVTS